MSKRRGKTYLALTGPTADTTTLADWDTLMDRARAIAEIGIDVFSLPFHRALPLLIGVEMAARDETPPRQ
jgi:hypothetical protein